MAWTTGDISGSTTLSGADHLYADHINELRESRDNLSTYSVKDYGAKGDNTTDDTAAINAALAAATSGGIVFFPAGTYLITADLTPLANTHVMGTGDASIVKLKTSGSNVANAFKCNNVTGVTISDLQIDGNKANIDQTNPGASYTVKQAVYITGGSSNIRVQRCNIHDIFGGGILADNASKLIISHNTLTNNGDNAIFLRSGLTNPWPAPSDCIVSHNFVSGGTYSGIGLVKAFKVTISNNVCFSNGPTAGQGSGITVEGSLYCTVSGNVCHDNGVNGIDMRYSNEGDTTYVAAAHCSVTGNTCYNNGYNSGFGNAGGIVTEGCDNTLIQGNNCYSNENGINIGPTGSLDPTRMYVQGNSCRTNRLIGIRFFTNNPAIDLTADGNYIEGNLSDQFTTNCKITLKGGLIARPPTAGKECIHLLAGSSGSVVEGVKMTDPIDNCLLIDTTVTGTIIRNCIFDKGAGSGGRGVYEATTTGAATVIENCRFIGFTFQSWFFNNTASVAKHNETDQTAWQDHSSGTDTFAAGTTKAVTHNLYTTPVRVQVMPTADPVGRLYISAKGATTFTVTNTSSTSIAFDWQATAYDN